MADRPHPHHLLALAAALVLALPPGALAAPDDVAFFENRVRPVLAERCTGCHGAEKQRSGLRLDSVAAIRAGGERGALFVPGEPQASLIARALSYRDEELQMPPKGRLDEQAVRDILTWIENGAALPEEAPGDHVGSPAEDAFELAERGRHFAYQPLAEAPVPAVADRDWPLVPADAFLRAAQETAGIEPAPDIDRRAWLRRVHFDIVGLPPTPGQTAAFLADEAEDADARVVDRLLASPRFGERWARHWLDLVRYADTRGHEFDFPLPNAWAYRDYVVRALNADVPYDDFVREHVAGDLLQPPRLRPDDGANESILGTGFWFFGDEVHSPVDTRADELDRLAGRIDTVGTAFLGLTVACARCHDHKFDAISTRDYYSLLGYPLSGSYRQVRYETLEHNRELAGRLATLRDEHGPGLAAAARERLVAGHQDAARWLLAARDALEATDRGSSPPSLFDGADAERLSAWVAALEQAATDPADPLHLFTLLRGVETNFEPVRDLALGALLPDVETQGADDMVVLFDFADPATPLRQNGFTWRYRAAGHARLAVPDAATPATGTHPVVDDVAPRSGAHYDPIWSRLAVHPESEGEPGDTPWPAPGRTLRTASFVLEHPRLAYLVRGPGHAYASVDGHRLIHGPLHETLVIQWPGDADYQWIVHELGDYLGHRLHLEFTPGDPAAEFAVVAVAGCHDDTPTAAPESAWIVRRLAEGAPGSVARLAQLYQEVFAAALAHDGSTPDPGPLALLRWLHAHPDLAHGADPALADRAAPYHDASAALLADVRAVSRTAPAMLEGSGVDEHVLVRGSHRSPGALAPRRYLEVFAGPDPPDHGTGSGRLDLAERIARSALAWRVLVNRVWHHLYGQGLVASVDDFGVMGTGPTHPELLDHLARRFAEQGFSIKALVRELVLSRSYRMGSTPLAESLEGDPSNRLLHHVPLRRLTAEAIRDAVLAVSGELDSTLYGPAVPMHLTEFLEGRGRPQESGPLDGAGRRSLYLSVRRNFPNPFFAVFDAPPPAAPMGRRSVSNVPAQALALMNDPFVFEQADRWAGRIGAVPGDDALRVTTLYEQAFTRRPAAWELDRATAFLAALRAAAEDTGRAERAAWRDLCHALYNAKEFVYLR